MLILYLSTVSTLLLTSKVYVESSTLENVKIDGSVIVGYQYSKDILAYTGIPYAQAPINHLRFEPPQPLEPSDILNDKAKENVMCAQISVMTGVPEITGEEDCLYLNIYVPSTQETQDISKYPVMIYIHGGAFAWGTGVIFKPDYLLREQNVILVSINYRLGPFGFLTAGSAGHDIYANNGMKDQATAIKWIHDHIGHFGGDNSKITLFGNSAGAASTHLHVFSPKTKGLFHSAIIQSGGAFCHFALQSFQDMHRLSAEFSRLANCPVLPTVDMIACLKTKQMEELLHTVTEFLILDVDPLVLFAPTIEPEHKDAFLIDSPDNLLKKGDFNDVPVMQGTTADEGAIRTAFFAKNPKSLELFDKHFHELYKAIIFFNHNYTTEQFNAIRKYYFGGGKLDQDNYKSLTTLLTDEYFRFTDDTVTFHRKYGKSPVYSYLFAYKGALTFSKVFANDQTVDLGVCHMDELFYLFPMEFFFANFENSAKTFAGNDSKMSLFMVKLWTHFAHYRNFDNFVEKHGMTLKWKPASSSSNEHLIIDQEFTFKMGANLYGATNEFWKRLEKTSELTSKDEL